MLVTVLNALLKMAVKTFTNHEMGKCQRTHNKLAHLWQKNNNNNSNNNNNHTVKEKLQALEANEG